MATEDWRRLCEGDDLLVGEAGVDVHFPDGRRHFVEVGDERLNFALLGIVAQNVEGLDVDDVSLLAWRRNRDTLLVGFRVTKGQLVGEAWVPKAGLTAAEFGVYVRAVARECDRFEYLLTGADVE